jgi:hypothetical protein
VPGFRAPKHGVRLEAYSHASSTNPLDRYVWGVQVSTRPERRKELDTVGVWIDPDTGQPGDEDGKPRVAGGVAYAR